MRLLPCGTRAKRSKLANVSGVIPSEATHPLDKRRGQKVARNVTHQPGSSNGRQAKSSLGGERGRHKTDRHAFFHSHQVCADVGLAHGSHTTLDMAAKASTLADAVDFETSDDVDVTPTFDALGLREDLVRGIYAYGKQAGGLE